MKKRFSNFALLAALLLPAAFAEENRKPEPYGIVAGTVFREPGFALPGAQLALIPQLEAGQTAGKIKNARAISDARGEFAFRVPAAPMRYLVKVEAKGFSADEKAVTMHGEERTEVTFQLRPESK